MNPNPELWTIRVTCAPEIAEALEELLGEEALAVSTLYPPRTDKSVVEAIVDGEPDRAALETRLALFLTVAPSLAAKTSAARRETQTERADAKSLSALFQDGTQANGCLTDIAFEIAPVGNLDWIKKVAEDFPPLPIARWTIFGAAHKKAVKNPRLGLQIDATSAFGTGEHPTTRGCLILLHEWLKRHPEAHGWRMLDMGCGSGILAMAFAKASRGRAIGVDMDGPSVKIAKNNARHNGVKDYVQFEKSLGYRLPLIRQHAPYDLIMANIFARPLCQMAKDLKRHLRPGGTAILSGLLNTQANAVLSAHRAQGLYLTKRLRLGEWSVLALCRPIKAS